MRGQGLGCPAPVWVRTPQWSVKCEVMGERDETDVNLRMERCFSPQSIEPMESLESLELVGALASMRAQRPVVHRGRSPWSATPAAYFASTAHRPPPP